MISIDSFKSRKKLVVGAKTYFYYSLKAAEKNGLAGVSRLPYSLKVLLENLLRHEDGRTVTKGEYRGLRRLADSQGERRSRDRLSSGARLDAGFHRRSRRGSISRRCATHLSPSRRSAKDQSAGPVDLVIDHSVIVDYFGTARA